MKKGLLSILAGALLVVGCQNYDDQFDQLESQINALASTVAGLSAVQSDLASLSAQVNSLSGAVDAAVDAALAGGLADIEAAIETLNAAAEAASSNSDIGAIKENVEEVQSDLAELLAQSSVFQGNVVVSTPAMLDAYHAMGDGLAIINGYVDIDVTSEMNIVTVQELVDFILVTTGDYAYTAGTGVDTEVTFSNLTGTQSLTLDQEGGYMLENLESATIIELDDDSSVDVVHLGSLTSATSISDGSGAGTFTFAKGTELHLTSLPRSPSTALSLGVDEGGVIALDALTDVDAAGDDTKLNLTIAGPASFTLPAGVSGDKSGSTLAFSEVGTLTVNGYDGAITIDQDVLNFASDNVVALTINGNDLVTVDITGALDPNATTADTEGPDVTLKGQGDLETVSIAGKTDEIVIGTSTEGNGNLVSVTIAGDVVGAEGISIENNSDLTTVDISGANTDKVVIDGNSDLETLTVDFTAAKGLATTQEGTISVNNNESLESLTISTDNIDNLTITNNADLETIDLSGMTAIGATGTAAVKIYDNDLTAEKSDNLDDGDTNVADGKTGDLGSFTTASGMDTASAYLTAVAADADSTADVRFDTVDSAVSNEGASETDLGSDITKLTDKALTQVLVLTPKDITTPAQDATKHKKAWGVVITGGTTKFGVLAPDGSKILVLGDETAVSSLTLDANETLAIAAIKRAAALTRATAYDLTLDAHSGYKPTGIIRFTTVTSTAEYGLNTTQSATTIRSASDVLKLTIDGKSVTTTVAGDTSSRAVIVDALVNRWNAVYGTVGTASAAISLFKVTTDTGANSIDIIAKTGSGRRGFDKSYSVSVTPYTTVGASTTLLAEYGTTASSADNNTQSGGIIVTLESNIAGVLLDAVQGASPRGLGVAGAKVIALSTTNKPVASVATTTAKNIYPEDARGDSVLPEASVTEVATAATTYNRVSWL
jgi:hypothetical protein